MHSVFLHIGVLTIRWYGVMMALGFIATFINWTLISRKAQNLNFCSDLLFWIMISGIAGARLAYIFSDPFYFMTNPWLMFRIDQGGLIYYGGVAGACIAIFIFARIRKEKPAELFDLVITALPLAHAFGRIGCFLNGCCYGKIYDGPLSVAFPEKSPPWWNHVYAGQITRFTQYSLKVHPVQLYEAAFNLVLYVILILLYKRQKKTGLVTAVYMLAYSVGRFFIEFLRGDERMYVFDIPITVAQTISIGIFMAGIFLLRHVVRKRT